MQMSLTRKVSDLAWSTLGTGFGYKKFADNLPRQNIEMKHVANYWAEAALDENPASNMDHKQLGRHSS